MSTDEPSYINQLCPRCYRAMISLAGYVSEGSWDESDETGNSSSWNNPGSSTSEFWLIGSVVDWVSSLIRRWRFKPIANKSPHSLYCTRCGYIQRRA